MCGSFYVSVLVFVFYGCVCVTGVRYEAPVATLTYATVENCSLMNSKRVLYYCIIYFYMA